VVTAGVPYEELFERASRAASESEYEQVLAEIEGLLETTTSPSDLGRLLMCRGRVRSNQWRTAAVFEDARAAMRLFEVAGDGDLVVDAASWSAAHASRMDELTVAAELATRSLLALEWVDNERLRMEVTNRLGIFCVSFLDYARAIEQFEESLAAAERLGDRDHVCRALHNIADSLLVIARQKRLASMGTGTDELTRAEAVVRELLSRATEQFTRRTASHRLLADALCESGRVDEALAVLDRFRDRTDITPVAQRAALAWVEARCLRLAGRAEEAVAEATKAAEMARRSDDDLELMLALEELAACQKAAGDANVAFETEREVKARLWAIHQRQTRQLVEEVWRRADFIRDQATLQAQAADLRRAEGGR
jgi:pentatricopeptide repeat protein